MVHVTSEIGRLRRVLVHEPGPEVDRMVPAMMEELLFDDILYGDRAREEHAVLRRVLQLLGVEVVEVGDLLAEVLGSPEARAWLTDLLLDDLEPSRRERIRGLDSAELATALVCGFRADRDDGGVEVDDLFALAPIPNWCFQRDPQVVLGDGVVFGSMAAPARRREALIGRALFRFHARLADVEVLFDPLAMRADRPLFTARDLPTLEGGDVLVIDRDVLLVGWSERTNRTAIRALARALARREGGPRRMFVVGLPRRRAYMHLDTLITPVGRDACLVYPPVVLDGGSEAARVFEADLHARELTFSARPRLLPALRERGIDLEPIPCGGSDAVTQQREQWSDGANALAVAPDLVLLYDRNVATADELGRRGFRVVQAEDLLLGRSEADPDSGVRACVLVPSHEISRARGGPHCLTHPLVRDDV